MLAISMEKSLKISLIQTDTIWESIDRNLDQIDRKTEKLGHDTDLILLPELFSTGFTMGAAKIAESMDGKAVKWMKEKARSLDCLVMGSLVIKENDFFYNRLVTAFPNGNLLHYDKRHLFSYAGEDKVFKAGQKRLVFSYKGFRICPLICYDLRFPVWSRNTEDIDLLIYVANWPDARMTAWDTLLKARAIENLCYVAAVNRVGVDNNKLNYTGHSALYDAMGNTVMNLKTGEEAMGSVTIETSHIQQVRSQFRFLEDRDEFEIR